MDAVIEGLGFIFTENQYADKVVEKLLKKDKIWGARDMAFVAEKIKDKFIWKSIYAEIILKIPLPDASKGNLTSSLKYANTANRCLTG